MLDRSAQLATRYVRTHEAARILGISPRTLEKYRCHGSGPTFRKLGGRVVCEERDLLYEEAPAAYKNIEVVIADLVAAGLVSVIATLRPLMTYKTRKQKR